MKAVDLLVFDLDGTLIDSRHDLANAVNHARSSLQLGPLPLERVVAAVGDGVESLMQRILEPENWHLKPQVLEAFRAYYGSHLLDFTKLQPGAVEILEHFQDKHKAVLTNKGRQFTLEILEGLGIQQAFDQIECGDNVLTKKPNSAGISKIMEACKTTPQKTVMVGDSPVDIATGRSVGAWTCVVLDGFVSAEILRESHPDFLVHSLFQLKECFN